MARSGYRPCKKDSDCVTLKCPNPFGHPTCVKGGCECPLEGQMALPDDTKLSTVVWLHATTIA